MTKAHMKLNQSEGIVLHCASRIYAAYISAGRVPEGEEKRWMERSILQAIRMADATDDAIISDDEVDTVEGETGRLGGGGSSKFS